MLFYFRILCLLLRGFIVDVVFVGSFLKRFLRIKKLLFFFLVCKYGYFVLSLWKFYLYFDGEDIFFCFSLCNVLYLDWDKWVVVYDVYYNLIIFIEWGYIFKFILL